MFAIPDPRSQSVRTTLPCLPETRGRTRLVATRSRVVAPRPARAAVDGLVRLPACIEPEGGVVTSDEVRHAFQGVGRPASGVPGLRDASILHGDFAAPFDGDPHAWHFER